MLPRVTVVVAMSSWKDTRRCLDALRVTLGSDLQVVGIVGPESVEAARRELANYPWVDLVATEVDQGLVAGRNRGAEAARGRFIVFLNGTPLVTDGWLDDLLAPLEDAGVGAAGPWLNVDLDDHVTPGSRLAVGDESLAELAPAWGMGHTGETSEVARLSGRCLALRAETFRDLGGFDEGYVSVEWAVDDLCLTLRSRGRRLVVAPGSAMYDQPREATRPENLDRDRLIADDGHHFAEKWHIDRVPPLCLLSVCLIVKDEEEMLGACLDSVRELADEVVIYDTGSTDRTVEIARAAGARVIEGYWDDSFARARNAVLSYAFGEWVLSLDADETFFGDARALRARLTSRDTDVEGYSMSIENLHAEGAANSTHVAVRLFRRTSVTWRHRLHEQPVARDELGRPLRLEVLVGSRLLHRGYVPEIFDARKKAQRNLVLARAAVGDAESDGSEDDRAYALMNYGRSLVAAGRGGEAVDSLLEAVTLSNEPMMQRVALKTVISALSGAERFDEALGQIDEFRRRFAGQVFADVAEGSIKVRLGDYEGGLNVLAKVPQRCRDEDGMEYGTADTVAIRAEALASLRRYAEAVDLALDVIREGGLLQVDLVKLTYWLEKAERSPSEIADAIEPDDLLLVLSRVLDTPSAVADCILERAAERFPERVEVLVVASRLAPRLSVERALMWSSRLRQRGLASACPLVAIVDDENRDPELRILAGAAAYGAFGDCAVVNGVHQARARLSSSQLDASTAQIERLAPGLLEARPVDATPPLVPEAERPSRFSDRRRKSHLPALFSVAPDPKRGGINVVGSFRSTSLDGEMSRLIVTALRRGGVSVSTAAYDPDGRRGSVPWESEGSLPYDTNLLVMSPESLREFVADYAAGPFEGRYVIGVWRSEFDVPRQSVGEAATMVHEVWAPSKFSVDALRRVTDRTIMEVPLPLAASHSADDVREGLGGFTFLTSVDYAEGFERQNPLGVVTAFCEAFREGEGPSLLIETVNSAHHDSEHRLLLDAIDDRSDIRVRGGVSRAAGALLDHVDRDSFCYVSLHRSEGTGLGLIRAMLDGVVTIMTDYSFGTNVTRERGSFTVPCTLHAPAEGVCGPGARWADPDLQSAASRMREVVDAPVRARQRAAYARDRARRQFSASRSVRIITRRIAEIDHSRYGSQAMPTFRDERRAARLDVGGAPQLLA